MFSWLGRLRVRALDRLYGIKRDSRGQATDRLPSPLLAERVREVEGDLERNPVKPGQRMYRLANARRILMEACSTVDDLVLVDRWMFNQNKSLRERGTPKRPWPRTKDLED